MRQFNGTELFSVFAVSNCRCRGVSLPLCLCGRTGGNEYQWMWLHILHASPARFLRVSQALRAALRQLDPVVWEQIGDGSWWILADVEHG